MRNLILAAFVLLFNHACLAVSPAEVFENGRRAQVLGHWNESFHHMQIFLETWPDHSLSDEALHYQTIADIRRQPILDTLHRKQIADTWQAALDRLKIALPDQDYSEIEVGIRVMTRESNADVPVSELLATPADRMAHMSRRGLLPDPEANPISTLEWVSKWLARNKNLPDSDLESSLHLMTAQALWRIVLSPLAAEGNSSRLKQLGFWPIDKAVRSSLDRAFSGGNLDTKRKAAILGHSFERLLGSNHRRGTSHETKWLKYLSERGIHHKEAWCP